MLLLQAAEATKTVEHAATVATDKIAEQGALNALLWVMFLAALGGLVLVSVLLWRQNKAHADEKADTNKLRLAEATARQAEIDMAIKIAREGWQKEQAINEGQHQAAMTLLKEQHKNELQYVKEIAESAQERLQEIQRDTHQHDLKNVEIIKEVSHQMQNIVSAVTTSIATRAGEMQVLREWMKEQFEQVNRNIDRNLEHLRRQT